MFMMLLKVKQVLLDLARTTTRRSRLSPGPHRTQGLGHNRSSEFDLMLELVTRLNAGGAGEFWLSVFEVKFLASQGQVPDWAKARLDAGTRAVAAKMASADWADLAKLRPSQPQLRRLAGFLDPFIRHHVGPVKRLIRQAS